MNREIRHTPIPLDAPIFVAGANGMVGSALVRLLRGRGFTRLLTPSSRELDLTDQGATLRWMEENRPAYLFGAAAKVGGIGANSRYPAEFGYINLAIATHLIRAAYLTGVKKLLWLGSSCIYPKHAPQPIPEEALLTGPLEPTNEPYALAKIAALRLCAFYRRQYGCDFISAMPTNLFGPGDNFHPENSHVLPALLHRLHTAAAEQQPQVVIWGSGTPLREFHYVEDLADGLLWLMENYSGEEHRNIGTGEEISIGDLARKIAALVGYRGELVFDTSKPDGTPRKVMNSEKIRAAGWSPKIGLDEGLRLTYDWYLQQSQLRGGDR